MAELYVIIVAVIMVIATATATAIVIIYNAYYLKSWCNYSGGMFCLHIMMIMII